MAMSYRPRPRFEIARVLSRMTGVIGRNLPVFLGLALMLSGLPTLAAAIVGGAMDGPVLAGVRGDGGAGSYAWAINLLVSALLQAALIHGTVSDLNGRPASLGDCLATATRNVLPLVGISIVTTVAMVVGLALLVVPGVIALLALCVAAPAQVVEGHGVFSALGRSRDLTRGHRGAILLLFILFLVISLLVGGALELTLAVAALGGPGAINGLQTYGLNPLIQTFGALIGAAGVASIYFELRTIKEGASIETLAAAFD